MLGMLHTFVKCLHGADAVEEPETGAGIYGDWPTLAQPRLYRLNVDAKQVGNVVLIHAQPGHGGLDVVGATDGFHNAPVMERFAPRGKS